MSASGGRPARRAVWRWSWRMFRREVRGQVLLLGLLTAVAAVATAGVAAVTQVAATDIRSAVGDGTHVLEMTEPDAGALDVDVDAARADFDQVEVVERVRAPLPGLFAPLELRKGPTRPALTAPLLRTVAGRVPTAADEVALTDGAAALLGVAPGDHAQIAGHDLRVVGVVENPQALDDEFGVVTDLAGPPDAVSLFVVADQAAVDAFRPPSGTPLSITGAGGAWEAAVAVVAFSTVLLLLVSLVAAAAFTVVMRRRLRQVGLLAAIGATHASVRRVLVLHGTITGGVAAVTGALAGYGSWALVAPHLETSLARRIDVADAPVGLLFLVVVLQVAMATAAAWWPAREVARVPVVVALSGRPLPPRPVRRSVVPAVVLPVVGGVLLFGVDGPTESGGDLLALVAGVLAVAVGVLFVGPAAISVAGRLAARTGVGARIALRDLDRHRARSGSALAAITLVLGIALSAVLATSAAVHAADEGNLGTDQLMVRLGEVPPSGDVRPVPGRDDADLRHVTEVVDDIAMTLGGAHVVRADVPVVPGARGFEGLPVPVLTRPVDLDDGLFRAVELVHVATPELLAAHGVDAATLDPDVGFLTTAVGDVWLETMVARPERLDPLRLDPGYSSVPGTLVTTAEVERRGWSTAPDGWLLDAPAELTDAQLARARQLAAAAGLTIEPRDDQADLATARATATALGVAAALAVVAFGVGLVRNESATQVTILVATGATARVRRTMAAATALGLAGLGVALATVGAYVTMAALHASDLGTLAPVPWLQLAVVDLGVPVAAAAAGWVLAGARVVPPAPVVRG